jgi:hypothetical protein
VEDIAADDGLCFFEHEQRGPQLVLRHAGLVGEPAVAGVGIAGLDVEQMMERPANA